LRGVSLHCVTLATLPRVADHKPLSLIFRRVSVPTFFKRWALFRLLPFHYAHGSNPALPHYQNFTNGYPGHEKAFRAAMLKLIGQEKYDYFWDKFYQYFYAEADAKWFKGIGLNLQRLAINYRHLSDDLDPYVIKEDGFKYIDRVVKLVGDELLSLPVCQGGETHLVSIVAHRTAMQVSTPSLTSTPLLVVKTCELTGLVSQ
jgi:hypothetical protein